MAHGVRIYSDVTRASILKLLACLREAETASLSGGPEAEPRVYLYIHSNGGDAFAGLAAYDHLRLARVPLVAVADGMVASAASFLDLAADRRLILPHAYVRIHQLSIYGLSGKYAELRDEMANSESLMRAIESLYHERAGMDLERVRELLRQEIDMDAEQCVAAGIATDVPAKRPRVTSLSFQYRVSLRCVIRLLILKRPCNC